MIRTTAILGLILLAIGCKKSPPAPATTAPPVDPRNTNYQPGAGAMINSARAGKRIAAQNDFKELGTIVFAMELENNRMPTKEETRTELARNGQNLLKLIDEGAIIMPSQPKKDGLWAYEVDADKAGGIVLVANVVSRANADEVKKYLGQ